MAKKRVIYNVKYFSSIREMLDMAVAENGDNIAYIYRDKDGKDVSVSYKEFNEVTENLGAALTSLGLGKAHVANVSENSYKWICVYLTMLKSAGVYVPIDKELPMQDKTHLINDSESEAVFFSAKCEDWVRENIDAMPNVKYFIGLDMEEDESERIISFKKLLEKGKTLDKAEYDSLKSDPNELKMLVYTSGTTGMSKGVMLSEHNLCSSVYYGLQVSQVWERGLSVLPYNHTYEAVCDILVSLHYRTTLCICASLKDVAKDLKHYKPVYIYVVPAFAEVLYSRIMSTVKKEGKEDKIKLGISITRALRKIGIDKRKKIFAQIHETFGGNLRKIVCGGAPIRPEIGQFFDDIGIALIGGYGITECSPLVSVNDESFLSYDTVGFRLPCLEWRIDSPNEEGIGEICVKGDVVMLGYYKKPDVTAEVLKDGWFYTGDYGYITKDDQLVITGRKKNIIVLNNGKNIYPEEIEKRIGNIDYITEVVVRSLKNSRGEEYSLMAEVYIESDETFAEDKVLADIQEKLADLPDYKNVTKVVIRPEPFDKTTTRKIKR
ncbi:MAG: AMP-binding protein [Clostridia bacterium]|nr:AMP-binding protein [Clostridia bacterium]